jgi:hypothetical protein
MNVNLMKYFPTYPNLTKTINLRKGEHINMGH